MATTLGFKDIIDLPEWRPCAPAITAMGAGSALMCDQRNDESRDPNIYQLASVALLAAYNIKNDEWIPLASPALAGAFAVGAGGLYIPSGGSSGTLAAGSTTTSVVISTALPTAVAPMGLANRGDGRGYKLRIIGNSAGSSGKTEERFIIGNSGGTQPTVYLDSGFTFTPANGDRYEFLSGALMLFSAGALAAGIIKKYNIATQTVTSLTTTNFIATIAVAFTGIVLDEQYVPYNRSPGDGMLGGLTATGVGATSITGHASLGDASVLLNEYRNFQIRITQDTATPTAVGQRRRITSHTAGPSPVYTVSTWTVNPSANARYVIELNNDVIVKNGTTSAVTYSYAGGFAADAAWSTAATLGGTGQYANSTGNQIAGSMFMPAWGIVPDTNKNARQSHIYYWRGGGVSTVDLFDIAAAATGTWTDAVVYNPQGGFLPTTANCSIYDASTKEGRYHYFPQNILQRFGRFDVMTRAFEPYAYMRMAQSTAIGAQRMAMTTYIDGSTKATFIYHIPSSLATLFSCLVQR